MAQVIHLSSRMPPGRSPASSFSDGPSYRQRVLNVLARYGDRRRPPCATEEQLIAWGERYESCCVGVALIILRGRGDVP